MKTYIFTDKNGNIFTGTGKDVDRARCAAKKAAGPLWSPTAKLSGMTNRI